VEAESFLELFSPYLILWVWFFKNFLAFYFDLRICLGFYWSSLWQDSVTVK
jgi:hypothetical protein